MEIKSLIFVKYGPFRGTNLVMSWGYFRYRNGSEGRSREGGIVFIKEGFVVL
jgi:hypothetical protein